MNATQPVQTPFISHTSIQVFVSPFKQNYDVHLPFAPPIHQYAWASLRLRRLDIRISVLYTLELLLNFIGLPWKSVFFRQKPSVNPNQPMNVPISKCEYCK